MHVEPAIEVVVTERHTLAGVGLVVDHGDTPRHGLFAEFPRAVVDEEIHLPRSNARERHVLVAVVVDVGVADAVRRPVDSVEARTARRLDELWFTGRALVQVKQRVAGEAREDDVVVTIAVDVDRRGTRRHALGCALVEAQARCDTGFLDVGKQRLEIRLAEETIRGVVSHAL